jgi:hypothetical protein
MIKINITIWMFILAGVLAILIALVTISFQTIKALLINPVKSLRSCRVDEPGEEFEIGMKELTTVTFTTSISA